MRSPLLHVASSVFDQALAIVPEKLEALLVAFGPRLGLTDPMLDSFLRSNRRPYDPTLSHYLQPHSKGNTLVYNAFDDDFDDDDLSTDRPNRKSYSVTSTGIAVLPVSGILMKRGGWMTALSGCSAYETLGKSYQSAVADASVRGILLDIDSPGGTTHGCFELSDLLYGLRSSKPVRAISNDLAASAAYAIASAADRIYVTRTGAVGSIGVFALHCDQSAADEKVGVKFTYVYAGDKKVDGNAHAPLSRSARKDIQVEVDREYDIFVSTVARNRSKSAEVIRATQAGVEYGDGAVPLLADAVMSYDEALTDFSSDLDKKSRVSVTMPSSMSGLQTSSQSDGVHSLEGDHIPMPKPVTPAADPTEPVTVLTDPTETTGSTTYSIATFGSMPSPDCPPSADEDASQSAASAADPTDTPSDEPDDDDEQKEKAARALLARLSAKRATGHRAPVSTLSPSPDTAAAAEANRCARISELCMIAGYPEKVGPYITGKYSAEQVAKWLLDKRAAISSSTSVSSSFGAPVKADSLHSIVQQARQRAASSHISLARALEATIMENPDLYNAYQMERTEASETLRGSLGYAAKMTSVFKALRLSIEHGDISAFRQSS